MCRDSDTRQQKWQDSSAPAGNCWPARGQTGVGKRGPWPTGAHVNTLKRAKLQFLSRKAPAPKMFVPPDLVTTLRTYPKEITGKRKNCSGKNNIHCSRSYNLKTYKKLKIDSQENN